MRISAAHRRPVVDRGGLPCPLCLNDLRWRTTRNRPTEFCGVPRPLANLSGDEMSVNLTWRKYAVSEVSVGKTYASLYGENAIVRKTERETPHGRDH